MEKIIYHTRDFKNGVHMLQRKYLGNGKFYIRGLFKGVQVGDTICSHTSLRCDLTVSEIISVSDSMANGDDITDEYRTNALVEFYAVYEKFVDEEQFLQIRPQNFGN